MNRMFQPRFRTLLVGLVPLVLLSLSVVVWSDPPATKSVTPPEPIAEGEAAASLTASPHKVMGIRAGDCKKCHPSEVAQWMKTVHFRSANLKLLAYEGNTKKYADEMGVKPSELMGNSMCGDCHGTKRADDQGNVTVVSGVGCESCHGASGGEDGWLNRHQSYHASKPVPRNAETAEHKADRLKAIDAAGMVRAPHVLQMARQCFQCHFVQNDKLVAAGHKRFSSFDYLSYSNGEIRHNFLLDRTKNDDAPSLWKLNSKNTAANRKRLKLVIGGLVHLEMTMRARATAGPAKVAEIGGLVAAANGFLTQVNAIGGTDETKAAMLPPEKLGLLFAPMPNDMATYTAMADKVAKAADEFAKNHDGSKLVALDAIVGTRLPHYSPQYKQMYGE